MFRFLKALFWIIAALAMALESSASPCSARADLSAGPQTAVERSSVICHDMMSEDPGQAGTPDAPDHERSMCCCIGLLGSGIALDTIEVVGPLSILAKWQTPMPDVARGSLVEHEPPPPRAWSFV